MTVRPAATIAVFFATLAATVLACIVQTQVNLSAITAMGVEVPPGVRLLTTAQDLAGFGRTMAPIALATLVLSQPVAVWLAGRLGRGRVALCAVAAGAGFYVAIALIDAAAPMPTLIAATRGQVGMLGMAAAVAAGGAVFGAMFGALVRGRVEQRARDG